MGVSGSGGRKRRRSASHGDGGVVVVVVVRRLLRTALDRARQGCSLVDDLVEETVDTVRLSELA